jgi:putative cell wall-binding protein
MMRARVVAATLLTTASLAAAPLAAQLGGPVLLTQSDALATADLVELTRLGAKDVWLAGGTSALSPAIATELADRGFTWHRFQGATRYDTARQIAEQVGGTSVFVTSATAWPDAVAVSGLAAAKQAPILLVDRDGVPADTTQALGTLHATDITVIGGASSVSDSVLSTLRSISGATVNRVAGSTRYETSLAVANAAVAQGFSRDHTWVATGSDWPDALAAGPASAALGGVLVLVDGHSGLLSSSLSTWLRNTTDLVVVGGDTSITSPAASALAAAL